MFANILGENERSIIISWDNSIDENSTATADNTDSHAVKYKMEVFASGVINGGVKD